MVNKVKRAMHEFKHGELHSGSSTGPRVQSRKQAIAIGLSEQRKANDPDNDGDGYADGGEVKDPKLSTSAVNVADGFGSTLYHGAKAVAGIATGKPMADVNKEFDRGMGDMAKRVKERADADRAKYADGGLVESARGAVSKGIETLARFAGTERGRSLDAADRAAGPDKRKVAASSIDDQVERMQKGYADGGLVRHRSNSGAYAEGGTVVHDRTDHGPKTLSESAKSGFRMRSRGRM